VFLVASLAGAAETTGAKLSAAEIADRNVAARGGLEAWRAVQTMTLSGKVGAGGNQRPTLNLSRGSKKGGPLPTVSRPTEEVLLPFVMELKRPRKMRFELQFKADTAVQVFDGANGWKLRPFLNRRSVEPYTADELQVASKQAELDGPLVDYAAKGTRIELAGMEKVEGRETYNLKLTLKGGDAVNVWIDSETFLEAKMSGQPRRLDGVQHPVEIYFREYHAVSGLQIPHVLETKILPVGKTALGVRDPAVPPERIVIEKVLVNPALEDSLFSKPVTEVAFDKK